MFKLKFFKDLGTIIIVNVLNGVRDSVRTVR